MPDPPDDATPEVYREFSRQAGVCVIDVEIDPFTKIGRFDSRESCSIRPKSQVWLSRTDPEGDPHWKALTVQSVKKGQLIL